MFARLLVTIVLFVVGGPLCFVFPIPFVGPVLLLWLLVKVWS